MRRLALTLLTVVLVLPLGCGSSNESVSTVEDGFAVDVRAAWKMDPDCKRPRGAERWSCSVESYRCRGVVTDRGWSISCLKPGGAVFFRIPPGDIPPGS